MLKKYFFKPFALIISLLIPVCGVMTASAQSPDLPYNTYFYVDEQIKECPATLSPETVISGSTAGTGDWNAPQDIYAANDLLYISDTDNNRVVILNMDYKAVRIIDKVYENGKESSLSGPTGLLADKNYVYIADTGNSRVIMVDGNNNVLLTLKKPDDPLFDQKRFFQPQKVLRDKNGYFYVLSLGTYEGALLYNPDGTFNSFFGGNRVTVTLSLLIENSWRRLLNKTQLSTIAKNIPQEYNSFDMDANEFIFTCSNSATESTDQLKKLNPTGTNVWETGKNYGDNVTEWNGSTRVVTRFSDIAADGDDFAVAIDSQRGHIFQYSATDGRVLSVTGNNGFQEGTFATPAAVDCYDNRIYVLDSAKATVTVFKQTEYGLLLKEALALYNDGRYDASYEAWEKVLKRNGNMQLAYTGIGKALVGKGEYRDAMKYFKLANDKSGYSEAFAAQRKIVLRQQFIWILPLALILIVAFLITGVMERRKRDDHATKKYNKWQFPFYIMLHPTNGFNDLRWTKRGSVTVATVIFAFWLVSSIMKKELSGFIFSASSSEKLTFNVWTQLLAMALLFILFVVINWAVCTLFEGKGTAKNIYIYTSYSLLPLIFSNYIYIALSYVFSQGEASFLSIINAVFLLWAAVLLLKGLEILHEYSLKQVILSIISTAFGIAIVVFLLLLLVSLFNRVASFVSSVINEFMLHMQQ